MTNNDILNELREVQRNLSAFLVKSNRLSVNSVEVNLASQRVNNLINKIHENSESIKPGITTGDC